MDIMPFGGLWLLFLLALQFGALVLARGEIDRSAYLQMRDDLQRRPPV